MSDKNAHYQDFPEDWDSLITKIRYDKDVPRLITHSNIIPAIHKVLNRKANMAGSASTQGAALYRQVRKQFITYNDLINELKKPDED